MTGIVYNTTATFTLEASSDSHSSIFGEYVVRTGSAHNRMILKKGQSSLQFNTSQLIEFRKIIDKIIQDLETGVP